MPIRPGDVIVLTPESLVAGGDSLSRIDGLPVFTPGLFPGDRARVQITESKKGFARGKVLEVVDRGPLWRVEPCPVAESCGGCDWTGLRLDHQLRAKLAILRETLRRVGKIDAGSLPPIALHPSPLNYRLRSRLQYDAKRDRLGFFAVQSHEVIEISPVCEVVGPLVLRHLDELRDFARENALPSVSTFERDGVLHVSSSDDEFGEAIDIDVAGFRYAASTASFFQVNHHLLATLISLVTREASRVTVKDAALDLYGGVGFFALPLSRIFDRVVSVEPSPLSHDLARRNFANEHGSLEAVRTTTERFLERNDESFDFVMLDPPRAGVASGVMERIGQVARERICYLSCDPVTFARDASRLMRRGWSLSTLDLLDLFPNTHHIETFSSFVREGKG